MTLITIGITSYNAEDTIGRAINSALAQNWPALEVLVVDDASTDGSVARIETAIAGHDNARLIRRSANGGPAAARNTLLAEANGIYLAVFDDDDTSDPARVRTQHDRIAAHLRDTGEARVFCYTSGRRVYPNGYVKPLLAIGSRPKIPRGKAVADYLMFNDRDPTLFYGSGTPTCALMAPTALLRELGGFDEALRRVEDVDLAIRMALTGGAFIGCPETLFEQEATEGSDKTAEKNLEAELALLDKHADYLRSRGRYNYARQWFRIRYLHFSGQKAAFALRLTLFLLRFPIKGGRHLLRSGPARARHERLMKASAKV